MTTCTKQKAMPFWRQAAIGILKDTLVVLAFIIGLAMFIGAIDFLAVSGVLQNSCTSWNSSSFSDC